MKKTMELDFESCQKNIKQLNEELDDTKSKYNDKLDKCVDDKLDLKEKHRDEIEELKARQTSFGDDFCQRTLELREARIMELEIELDICNSGDLDTNFDDLKTLFD